ncbi:MAG: DNA replication and repair protein RecF [Rickettsiales bacterium]|jgi:DNA replication and repair protein RecF|nr:DNA replication and repair protein RecF [Rickettsiales bacterium]
MNSATYISEIILNNFRNYTSKKILFNRNFNVLVGDNGIGKTNILESISLFSNSRGLRNATNEELTNTKRDCPFLPPDILYSLRIILSNGEKLSIIQREDKKIIKINDEIIKKASVLNNFLNITFLIPQMDSFFTDSSSVRRKFLDKTAEILFIEHYENVKKYDFFVKERMKILLEQGSDDKWLNIVEKKITTLGVNIASVRNDTVAMINKILTNSIKTFPIGNIEIVGEIEGLLNNKKSTEVERYFLEQLQQNRESDAKDKRTSIGVHRSDVLVHNNEKNMRADLCSTGEQKMLLISLILARCIFSKQCGKGMPVLLLDEICSHIDENTKIKLFDRLKDLSIQTFITGLKRDDFSYLTNEFIEL